MVQNTNNNREKRIAPRSSLLMIITGAVFGWVLAFAVIYGVVRGLDAGTTEQGDMILANDAKKNANEVSKIQPAAGKSAKN